MEIADWVWSKDHLVFDNNSALQECNIEINRNMARRYILNFIMPNIQLQNESCKLVFMNCLTLYMYMPHHNCPASMFNLQTAKWKWKLQGGAYSFFDTYATPQWSNINV